MNLSEFDLKNIDDQLCISKSIYNLYEKLCDLEIKGLKETKEYNRVLEYLKISLEVEKKMYQNLNLDMKKCLSIIKYLSIKKEEFEKQCKSYKNSEALLNYLNYIGRIINYVDNLEVDYQLNSLEKEKLSFLTGSKKQETIEEINKTYTSSTKYRNCIAVDYFNAYLMFLQESINSQQNKIVKNQLIRSKYIISYLNDKIEKEMILDDFCIMDSINLLSDKYENFEPLKHKELKGEKTTYHRNVVINQINKLLSIKNQDYTKTGMMLQVIIIKCIMMASFINLDNYTIESIREQISRFINSSKFKNKKKSTTNSIKLIYKCLNSIPKEKEKINNKVKYIKL